MKQDITDEWQLYESGKDYNNKLHPPYYPTIDKNYRFYSNDQWFGVQAGNLPTPVFNIIKPVIDYKISSVLSSKVKMKFGVENTPDETEDPQEQELKKVADMLSGYADTKWEKLKIDSLIREGLLDGALSGDMCFYTYWDPKIDTYSTSGINTNTNEPAKIMGDFCTELVDGQNVMFGNPNNNKVQTQPYIIIVGRDTVTNLKKEAKENKVSKDKYETITSDEDTEYQAGDRGKLEIDNAKENDKCTYLIKMWKENGTVMLSKSTKFSPVKPAKDTGLKLYPLAWMNWTRLKNSYHGQAESTGLIPNQISINQLFAMILYHMRMTAFGKVLYDKNRIAAWNNAVGAAIGVEGDTTGAVQQIAAGQMNNMVIDIFREAISQTKDLSGANDAALGNIDPKNQGAIIAVQKASQVPLQSISDNLYQFIEDLGLIWLDFMLNKYGDVDRKISYKEGDTAKVGSFNAAQYQNVPFKLKIDVGPSSYWSEISSIQTLDNLLSQKIITPVQYLERLPNGQIEKKQELIEELSQQLQNEMSSASNNYEQMAQFMESLPPDVQAQLKAMPDKQMEETLLQMMQTQGGGMNA
jgi:hypothetical protein